MRDIGWVLNRIGLTVSILKVCTYGLLPSKSGLGKPFPFSVELFCSVLDIERFCGTLITDGQKRVKKESKST